MESAKKGRGRPPKAASPSKRARDDDGADTPVAKRPRGRPPGSGSNATPKSDPNTPKRGRGRPPKAGGSTPAAKKPKLDPVTGEKRGRGRPPKAKSAAATPKATPKAKAATSGSTRGRGRPRKSEGATPSAAAKKSAAKGKASNKQAKVSDAEDAADDDDDEDEDDTAEGSAAEETEDAGADADATDVDKDGEEEPDKDDEGDEDEGDEEEYATAHSGPSASFGQAFRPSAAVAYVPQATISRKWGQLDAESQARARSCLADAALPVIAAGIGARAGAAGLAASLAAAEDGPVVEAQAVVNKTIRTLGRRLAKQPFPPRATAAMFDHEGLLRDNKRLTRTVVTQTREVEALDEQVRKVTRGIESAEHESDRLQEEYEREKEDMRARHAGEHGRLLKMPEDEPADSARRIKLAPWKDDSGGGGGGGGHGGGGGEDAGNWDNEAAAAAAQKQARTVADALQAHLAEIDSEDVADDLLEADIDRATAAIGEVLRLRRQTPRARELAAAS